MVARYAEGKGWKPYLILKKNPTNTALGLSTFQNRCSKEGHNDYL